MVSANGRKIQNPIPGQSDKVGGDDWNKIVEIINGEHETEKIQSTSIETTTGTLQDELNSKFDENSTIPVANVEGLGTAINKAKPVFTYNIDVDDLGVYTATKKDGVVTAQENNFSNVLNAVITDIGSNPANIVLGEGQFVITSTITINNDNIVFTGKGDGITNIVASSSLPDTSPMITTARNQTAASHDLTAVSIGDTRVQVANSADLSNYASGDIILVYNDDDIPGEIAGRKKGYLYEVERIDIPTDNIFIYGRIEEDFLLATNPKVVKLDYTKNLAFHGVEFNDQRDSITPEPGPGYLAMDFVENLSITDCNFIDCISPTVRLRQCIDIRIHDNHMVNSKVVPGNLDYFVAMNGGKQLTMNGNVMDGHNHTRDAFTSGGGVQFDTPYLYSYASNIVVSDNVVRNIEGHAIDCHEGVKHVIFSDNVMTDTKSSGGLSIRGFDVIAANNIISNCGSHGILITDNAHKSVLIGNKITNCPIGINSNVFNLSIIANVFDSCTVADINRQAGDDWNVSMNKHMNSTAKLVGGLVSTGTVMTSIEDGTFRIRHDDDNQGSGLVIESADGRTEIVNNNPTPGAYSPTIKQFAKGNTVPCNHFVKIEDTDDVANSNSLQNIIFSDVDDNAIVNRTVLQEIRNDTNKLKILHTNGDDEIATANQGLILKSANGTRYRLTVDNAGALVITAV